MIKSQIYEIEEQATPKDFSNMTSSLRIHFMGWRVQDFKGSITKVVKIKIRRFNVPVQVYLKIERREKTTNIGIDFY